jgi:hypothetical protein
MVDLPVVANSYRDRVYKRNPCATTKQQVIAKIVIDNKKDSYGQ